MTKEMIWVGLAFLLILTICVGSSVYISHRAEEICGELAPMEQAIAAEDWPRAESCYERAVASWNSTSQIWKMMLDHDSMRDIELGFVDLQILIAQKNRDRAAQEVATLLFYIGQVPDNEKPDPGNIF